VRHELVGDTGRGVASRIEIATDAVDLVVTESSLNWPGRSDTNWLFTPVLSILS